MSKKTKIVGICNVTPDSFSDGGLYFTPENALNRINEMFAQGADLVDVGAVSTRPGAEPVDEDAEWRRLDPVFSLLCESGVDITKISLDTTSPKVAARFLDFGGVIINDVSGLRDVHMRELVATTPRARCVVTHLPCRSIEESHALSPKYDSVTWVLYDIDVLQTRLWADGITNDRIIIDPGIGFGKTARLNLELVEIASQIACNEVMIGYSRKKFLGERRNDTDLNCRLGYTAIYSGAAYLRVHDVAEHVAMRASIQ